MTRLEAIQRLTDLQDGSGQTYEAIRIAIESLSADVVPKGVLNQFRWEREKERGMTESCKNCKFSFPITHWDYTKVGKGEEWKKDLDGMACVLFTTLRGEKPFVIWKTGSDDGICECWAKRKGGDEDAKRSLLVEYARESENMRKRNAKLEVMLNAYREMTAEPRFIDALPSADRPKGEWIIRDDMPKLDNTYSIECSKCGQLMFGHYNADNPNFCPHCGADMRGEDND